MEVAITKLSSKGQIVIPLEMRKGFKEGDKIFLLKEGKRIVLRRAKDLDEKLREDLEFARRTEEAYRRHERGDSIVMDGEEFIKELERW